jgi:hypothetical protein
MSNSALVGEGQFDKKKLLDLTGLSRLLHHLPPPETIKKNSKRTKPKIEPTEAAERIQNDGTRKRKENRPTKKEEKTKPHKRNETENNCDEK